jgi:hypothetical protein
MFPRVAVAIATCQIRLALSRFGHVIVLTGVDGNVVHLNDPDQGAKKVGTLDWFNAKLMSSLKGCLMYKNPDAY